MNKATVKVYKKGGAYIGVLPSRRRASYKHSAPNPILKPFREAYRNAEKMGLKKGDIEEYVKDELLNGDGCYIIDDEDYKNLVKREANRRHQILKRYYRKVEWFTPNYFVTFTYDDEKTNEVEFEQKLLHTIANFAHRHGWRGMGAAERGKKGGRLHYHFMLYIPDGEMVGELFTDCHWNERKRKREYFTNNKYFNERFGTADFKRVTVSDREKGAISDYLVKYIVKDGGHIYYTRHLPTEKEMEIDLDEDVFATFKDYYSIKVILGQHLFYSPEELDPTDADDWTFIDGADLGWNPDTERSTKRCA